MSNEAIDNSEKMPERPKISRRAVVRSILAAGTGLMGWSCLVEPVWLQTTFHRLNIPELPQVWKGRRLVQISDFHIGCTSIGMLQRAMREVNRLKPDILVITGDFIDRRCDDFALVDSVLEILEPAKIATLGCLGNHDFGEFWHDSKIADEVTAIASKYGVRMLRNELVGIEGVEFSGIEDYWSPNFSPQAVASQALREVPTICLCHNPDVYDHCDWSRFQGVILAGHTHGGQCKPPFLPPPMLPVYNRRYTAGFFDLAPGQTMYINRGLGYSYRVRFNCRPEISVFELS